MIWQHPIGIHMTTTLALRHDRRTMILAKILMFQKSKVYSQVILQVHLVDLEVAQVDLVVEVPVVDLVAEGGLGDIKNSYFLFSLGCAYAGVISKFILTFLK